MKQCLPSIVAIADFDNIFINRIFETKASSILGLLWFLALAILFSVTPSAASANPGKPISIKSVDGTKIEMGQRGDALYWKLTTGGAAGAQLQLILADPVVWAGFSQEKGPRGIIVTTRFRTKAGKESQVQTRIDSSPALLSVSLEPDAPNADWLMLLPWADRIVFQSDGRYGVLKKPALSGALPESVSRMAMQKSAEQEGVWLSISDGAMPRQGKVIVKNDTLEVLLPLSRGSVSLGRFKGDSLLAMEQMVPPAKQTKQTAQKADACSTASPMVQKWRWFSDEGRMFAPLKADPREAAFHLGFMQDDNGETFEDVAVGGDLGILHVSLSDGAETSLTMRGLLTARFDMFSKSFDLLNTDFLGGPALGYKKGPWSWEAFAYHQSSHLGDEVLEDGTRRRIDYSREVVRFLGARSWDGFRLYAGPSYILHSLPKSSQGDLTMQAGLEYGFSLWDQPCFAATDIQSRQENDWNLNLTARVGVDLGNPWTTRNRQFIFLELFQGYSNMGQYYDVWERYAMIGIGYNFR